MNIFQRIKLAFSRLGASIAVWFNKAATKAKLFLNKEIPVAIMVGNALKSFLDSPVAPVITMLIPGDVDDKIAAKIKEFLPQALTQLRIYGDCAKRETTDEIIQCAVKYLQTTTAEDKKSKLISLVALLSQYLSDGKLTWAECIVLVQSAFSDKFDNSANSTTLSIAA